MKNNVITDNVDRKEKRTFYLDVLRVMACLFVIVIHSSASYTTEEIGTANFWTGHFFNSIARAAVPLFVMISGALMLDEQYMMTKQKWIGHIRKMAVFYFGWSVIYCAVFKVFWRVFIAHLEIGLMNILDIMGEIINGHRHLWFVPMVIGLYLILPLLRLWIKRVNMKYVEYFLLLSAVFTFIVPHAMTLLTMVNPIFGGTRIFENLGMDHCMGYVSYFILGWYLNNKDFKQVKWFYLLGIAAFLMTFGATYAMIMLAEMNKYIFYDYFSISVCVYSVAIFVLCRERLKKMQYSDKLLCRCVNGIAKNSLGIYAVHYGLLELVTRIFYSEYAIVAVPVKIILVFVLSLGTTMVIRKIPVFKRLV